MRPCLRPPCRSRHPGRPRTGTAAAKVRPIGAVARVRPGWPRRRRANMGPPRQAAPGICRKSPRDYPGFQRTAQWPSWRLRAAMPQAPTLGYAARRLEAARERTAAAWIDSQAAARARTPAQPRACPFRPRPHAPARAAANPSYMSSGFHTDTRPARMSASLSASNLIESGSARMDMVSASLQVSARPASSSQADSPLSGLASTSSVSKARPPSPSQADSHAIDSAGRPALFELSAPEPAVPGRAFGP